MNTTHRFARLTLLLVLGLVSDTSIAAGEPTMHAGRLHHELERLRHTARVLYVAAHPDDENTRLLAYLANGRGLETAYLSMTRGGGGQNLIGTEQAELLDVLRTQELLAARSMDGARQFFTRMRDFGYSKTAEETLRVWGHEEALADVVWVIRRFQPDVIVTRFDELPGNHGHHTASAILAREAFTAAADAKRFPKQLELGVQVWQAKRLVHNFATWRDVPVPEGALSLDVGAYDPWLGESYGELAARSRSQHKSQGFGVAGERGPLIERFVHVAGTPAKVDVLEGVELGWTRYGKGATELSAQLDEAAQNFSPEQPERSLALLAKAATLVDQLPDDARTRDAREDLQRLMARTAGLYLRAAAKSESVAPGAKLALELELTLRRPATARLLEIRGPGLKARPAVSLGLHERKLVPLELHIDSKQASSMPYWLALPANEGRQNLSRPSSLGAPEGPPALAVELELEVDGGPVHLTIPVVHPNTDRVLGEREQPVLVAPPATVTPVREAVLSVFGKPTPLLLRVRAHMADLAADVTVQTPKGWKLSPSKIPVRLDTAGQETTIRFELSPGPGAAPGILRPVIAMKTGSHSVREDRIDHPHVPVQVVLRPSELRVAQLSADLPNGRFAYVHGSGDSVADDLRHIGLSVTDLDDESLRTADLSEFRAIIVGIRAYNTRASLAGLHARLMQYVEAGGTVVTQYNTSSRWDVLTTPIGPYPLTVGRERITDQNAKMSFLLPTHALLTTPNRIVDGDFEGWIQERGLYFAENHDPRYQAVLAGADPGEAPMRGGLLFAQHGRGRYIYTGLAFFRQLPAGVPGAYRLFLNLLAGP